MYISPLMSVGLGVPEPPMPSRSRIQHVGWPLVESVGVGFGEKRLPPVSLAKVGAVVCGVTIAPAHTAWP